MVLAKLGKEIPKNITHDPTLRNNHKETVALLLAKK